METGIAEREIRNSGRTSGRRGYANPYAGQLCECPGRCEGRASRAEGKRGYAADHLRMRGLKWKRIMMSDNVSGRKRRKGRAGAGVTTQMLQL